MADHFQQVLSVATVVMNTLQRQLSAESDSSSSSQVESKQPELERFTIILKSLPKNIVHDAKDILYMMATSKDILFWDNHGQLSYHGRTIPGSNLSKLLEYVIFDEEEDIDEPRGLQAFMKGLAELKIDKKLINNHTVLAKILSFENKLYQTGRGKSEDEDDQEEDDDEDQSDEEEDDDEDYEDQSDDDDDEEQEDDDDDDPHDTCESHHMEKHTLRRCPDCHWVTVHNGDDSLMECSGCGNQQQVENFAKTHTIHHCDLCGEVQVMEHDGKEQDDASEDSYEEQDDASEDSDESMDYDD